MLYIIVFIFIFALWLCATILLFTENKNDPTDNDNAWKDREDDDE